MKVNKEDQWRINRQIKKHFYISVSVEDTLKERVERHEQESFALQERVERLPNTPPAPKMQKYLLTQKDS